MKRSFLILCAAIGAWSLCGRVGADHPTVVFSTEHGGPLNTISAPSLPAGAWALGLRTEVINFDAFSDTELADLTAAGIEDVHSIDQLISTSASVAYGFSDRLEVSIRVPWVWRDNIREGEFEDGEAEAHAHGDAQGIGDVLMLANYRVLSRAAFDLALQAGVKAPSGETHETDAGERLETEFQPASGSWDFLIGGAVGKKFGRFGVHANLLFTATTEGAQDTEFGDALLYNFALTFNPSADHDHGAHEHHSLRDDTKWEFMIEINGEQRWKDKVDGINEANSGGNSVYLSPGVRVSVAPISAFVSFGYPVVEDTNGWQSDIDFRLVGGVAIGF